MKCPNCGEILEKGAKFCGNCGTNVEQALNERVKKEAENKAKAEKEMKDKIKSNNQKADKKENVEENISDPVVNKEIEKIKEEYVRKKTDEKEIKREINTKKMETQDENNADEKPKFQKKDVYVKKNNSNGIRIFIILIIVLLVIFGGMYQLYKMQVLPEGMRDAVSPVFENLENALKGNKENDEKENEENITLKEIKPEDRKDEINKKDKSKELVYDYYTADIGDKLSRIPTINLNYENVQRINSEIIDFTEEKLKDAEKAETKEGNDLVNVDYIWYQNDDLLSVVVSLEYGNEKHEYHVYNINVKDGENVQNSKILEMANVSSEEFVDKCLEAVEDYFKKLYDKNNLNFIEVAKYEKAHEKTVDESNYSISDTVIYLNDKSELVFIAKIYTLPNNEEDERALYLENLSENNIDKD